VGAKKGWNNIKLVVLDFFIIVVIIIKVHKDLDLFSCI